MQKEKAIPTSCSRRTTHRGGEPKGTCKPLEKTLRPSPPPEKSKTKPNPRQGEEKLEGETYSYTGPPVEGPGSPPRTVTPKGIGGERAGGSTGEARSPRELPKSTVARGKTGPKGIIIRGLPVPKSVSTLSHPLHLHLVLTFQQIDNQQDPIS
jgi:hypothetical protein